MKKALILLCVIVLSYFSVRPLFDSGYFPIHDDTQVERVVEMGKALKEGQFPVRWVEDLGYGYGYPIFNFYGPLPYYVGGILYALGVPALTATKIMFGLGAVLPAISISIVVLSFVSVPAAMAAAALYLYAPYHAVQIFVRGAVGEYWILIFWPLIFWAILSPKGRYTKKGWLVGSMGIAGSVLSHTLLGYATVLLAAVGFACYVVVRFVIRKRIYMNEITYIMSWVLTGLGISAFFWLPAMAEMGYTSVSAQISATANYRDHFVCLVQLWSSAWGYGGSAKGCIADGLSFMLGKIHILVALIAVSAAFIWSKKRNMQVFMVAAGSISLIGVLLTLQISEPLWRMFPMFSYMQYPWRFLAVAGFGLALLGAGIIAYIQNQKIQWAVAALLTIIVLIFNTKWFVPQTIYSATSHEFETATDISWRASKISDEYLPPAIIRPTSAAGVVSDTITSQTPVKVTAVEDTATQKEFIVESSSPATLTVNTAYFPGWRYRVNDRDVLPAVMHGLPRLTVDAGQTVITTRFTDTPVRTLANLISAATCVFGIIFYVKKHKTNR